MRMACTIFGRGSAAVPFHDIVPHSDVTSATVSATLCFHKHNSPKDNHPEGQADREKEQNNIKPLLIYILSKFPAHQIGYI